MKKRYLFLIPLFAILLVGAFAMAFSIGANSRDVNPTNLQSIEYNSMVCTEVIRADGTSYDNGCSHNLLFDSGKEAIEAYLGAGTGAGDAFDWIELCDQGAGVCENPQANGGEVYTAHALDGLVKVAGTQASNAASGNWSVWNEFTSTADNQLTNVSHLINAGDTELAGNSFTDVTLQNGDKLLVNWTIFVT